jgi:hypothetical protein
MPEFDDAVRQEQVNCDKNGTCYPKRNVDRKIDQYPVGSQLGKGPGTKKVKNNGTDSEQNQNNS